MSNTRIYTALAAVILILAFLIYVTVNWAKKLPDQFSVERVYITIKPDSIFLKIRAAVPAKGIAETLFDSMRYSVAFDTTEFSRGMKYFGSEATDSLIDLPLGMDRHRLFSTIRKMQVKDSTQLNIKLEPFLRLPGTSRGRIPFTINKKIKVPIPPDITVQDIDMQRFRPNDLKLNATLQVINLNQIEFIIHDGNIRINFPDMMAGYVTLTEPVTLKRTDTTYIETTIHLQEVKVIKAAWNYAFKKDELHYSLQGLLHVASTDNPSDTIDVVIRK